MLIKKSSDIRSSEVTPENVYVDRRRFIGQVAAIGVVAAAGASAPALLRRGVARAAEPLRAVPDDDKLTPYEAVTSYNNFYEFGTGKEDPAKNAQDFRTRPWKVAVEGEIAKPGEYDLDDLLRGITMEERVYRLRCVEAWSMVIPWLGFPLSTLINRFEPTSKAKYVELTTLHDPEQMPGQRRNILPWPYVEGLRMDEATHPLAILATGLYGKELPNQNGAPLRLVVPWKYGFKSVKSIVRIRFVQDQPRNTWNVSIPHEYGFYANVNPNVDHPRWSQARERRIGEFFKRPTPMFNGYADQVAHLYEGMDLARYY
jgi:sulfoxide reductase catalytic subunit YedY